MLSKLTYLSSDDNNMKENNIIKPVLSYREYYNKNIVLKKYKIPELKQIAKTNHLRFSGNKTVLIERIREHFDKNRLCVQIQKIFRGHIVRLSFLLRGDVYRDYKLCVNEMDFYTMEQLSEIPIEQFMTFKSNDGLVHYGCNIISLIHLFYYKPPAKNPYNRDVFSLDFIKKVIQLYHLVHILYHPIEGKLEYNTDNMIKKHENHLRSRGYNATNHIQEILAANPNIVLEKINLINTIRAKDIQTRIQELFIEIDLLGNYTNYRWFTNLTRREYIILYRVLYEIWHYRGNLSMDMRQRICILENPFLEFRRFHMSFYESTFEEIRNQCLHVFEHMVYCGIDDEHRNIGALHALSGLTYVSRNARHALPWLYESLFT